MSKWEDEGFASEAAYINHLVKAKEEAEAKAKALEKQEEERKANEAKAREEADRKAKEEAEAEALRAKKEQDALKEAESSMSDAEIKAANDMRIASLPAEQLEALAKEFEEATAEQKALLTDPRAVKAFIDIKCPASSSTHDLNPFKVKERELTIDEKILQAFGKVKDKPAPSSEVKGSGFTKLELSESASTRLKEKKERLDNARRELRR
jgi:hypothetical protein